MTKLNVPEMSCGHCVATIEKAIAAVDATASVDADLEKRTISIDTAVSDAALIDALKAGGYEATVV